MSALLPRRLALACAALAASLVLAPSARAATEMRTGGPPAEYVDYLKMKPMQAMHAMDGDQKGFVTREEFLEFHQELFDRMDKNHDGKVSVEEWLGRAPHQGEK